MGAEDRTMIGWLMSPLYTHTYPPFYGYLQVHHYYGVLGDLQGAMGFWDPPSRQRYGAMRLALIVVIDDIEHNTSASATRLRAKSKGVVDMFYVESRQVRSIELVFRMP